MNPLVMHISVGQFSVFSIKLENRNIPTTLDQVASVWNEFFPEETFDYNFLDESLDQNYAAQERLGRTVGYFAFLAILISCLGSYGLIMFIATGKMKEVGIHGHISKRKDSVKNNETNSSIFKPFKIPRQRL